MSSDRPDWYYARSLPYGGFRVFEQRVAEAGLPSTLVVDPFYGTQPVEALEKRLLDLPSHCLDVDLVIFRAVPEEEEISEEQVKEAIHRRISKTPTVATVVTRQLQAPSITSSELDSAEASKLLPLIGQIEFTAQLEWTHAIHRPTDGHFLLPAGTHADAFVRIGDAFTEIEFVERLADWLTGDLANTSVLVADTWTILPLLQELSGRIKTSGRPAPKIHTFRAYPTALQFEHLIDSLSGHLGTEGDVLFVVSAVSSASLLTNVNRFLPQLLGGSDRLRVRILAETNETGAAGAITRIGGIRRYDVPADEPCQLCRDPKKGPRFVVDPRTYTPRTHSVFKPEMLGHTTALQHRSLWESCTVTEAIRLHFDERREVPGEAGSAVVRHHIINFDVARLLAEPSFHREAMLALRSHLPVCDLVVIPLHSASESLRELANRAYPEAKVHVLPAAPEKRDPDTTELEERLREVGSAAQILILDDAVIQGRSIRSCHRLLQEVLTGLGSAGPHEYSINAFVVIGRPASQGRWDRLINSLRHGNRSVRLGYAARIYLPDDPLECPWCKEAAILDTVLTKLADPSVRAQVREYLSERSQNPIAEDQFDAAVALIQARLDHLKRAPTSGGRLAPWVYLCDSTGKCSPGEMNGDRLTRNSLFGEQLSAAAAFTGVAEAMQSIRNTWAGEKGVLHAWDIPKILTAYHDPLLSAAFLRSIRAEEVALAEASPAFEDALAEISFSTGPQHHGQSPLLAAEMEWSVVAGMLPEDFSSRIERRLEPILSHHPTLRLALELIGRIRLPHRELPRPFDATSR